MVSGVNDIHLKLEDGEKIAFISDVHVDSKMPDSRVDDIIVTLKLSIPFRNFIMSHTIRCKPVIVSN